MTVAESPPVVYEDRSLVGSVFRLGVFCFLASGFFSGIVALSNLFFAVALGSTLLALLLRRSMHRIVIWPTSFLGALLLSGLAVGSLPDFQDWERFQKAIEPFLTGEGRVFLAFTPLLLAAIARPDSRSVEFVVKQFRLMAWAGIFMATVGRLQPFRGTLYKERTGQLFALASSHHVAGFLFGIAALVLLTTHRGKRQTNLLLGLGSLGVVIASGSRTTIVGIAVAAVVALAMRSSSPLSDVWLRRFRVSLVGGILLLLPLQTTLRVQVFEPEVIASGLSNISERDPLLGTGAYESREANVYKRFALWGDGLDSFVSSPLLGVGAFRFNDEVDSQWGIEGFVYLATDGRRLHDVTTAHNSYVHISAELGVVGLALLVGMWLAIAREIRLQRDDRSEVDSVRSDADGALLLVAFALGTALTSSSILTPGLSIPVLCYCGTVAVRGDLQRLIPVRRA